MLLQWLTCNGQSSLEPELIGPDGLKRQFHNVALFFLSVKPPSFVLKEGKARRSGVLQ
jgi:hypothetical protein